MQLGYGYTGLKRREILLCFWALFYGTIQVMLDDVHRTDKRYLYPGLCEKPTCVCRTKYENKPTRSDFGCQIPNCNRVFNVAIEHDVIALGLSGETYSGVPRIPWHIGTYVKKCTTPYRWYWGPAETALYPALPSACAGAF